METIERLFRRFRQVDPTDTASNGSSMQAVSATNQLLVIRERLQAGLSARLLELKMEMDKEFGTAFVDMESYLRTEKGKAGGGRSRFCSHGRWCACSFLFVLVAVRWADAGRGETLLLLLLVRRDIYVLPSAGHIDFSMYL